MNKFIYLPQSLKNIQSSSPEFQQRQKHRSPCKVHYFQVWQCTRDHSTDDGVVVLAREKKVVSSLSVEEQLAKQDLYKTELCRSFVETGSCRYGKKCRFAHGIDELRPVLRHPKYKTQICACFYNTGFCPYGLTLIIQLLYCLTSTYPVNLR